MTLPTACCPKMEEQLNHVSRNEQFDDVSCFINYISKFDEYGLIIHDGGNSHVLINFCPWCGQKLPTSKRDEWFEKLESLGFDDPTNQKIPEKFKSNKWFSNDN